MKTSQTNKASGKFVPSQGRQGRSSITNGSTILPGVDGRSLWARRFRDLIELHIEDKGGPANCSHAEVALHKRAACLIVELERFEVRFASNGGGKVWELNLYQRMTNTLRRILETLGLDRRPRDVTPADDHAKAFDRFVKHLDAEDVEEVEDRS